MWGGDVVYSLLRYFRKSGLLWVADGTVGLLFRLVIDCCYRLSNSTVFLAFLPFPFLVRSVIPRIVDQFCCYIYMCVSGRTVVLCLVSSIGLPSGLTYL